MPPNSVDALKSLGIFKDLKKHLTPISMIRVRDQFLKQDLSSIDVNNHYFSLAREVLSSVIKSSFKKNSSVTVFEERIISIEKRGNYYNCITSLGNVFVTGEYNGTIDIDPGPGTTMLTSNGGSDIFIQKLDSNGNFVWGKSIGGQFNDFGTNIIVDSTGNIYVSGAFRSLVDFDPNSGSTPVSSNGLRDIFILKLNSKILMANTKI